MAFDPKERPNVWPWPPILFGGAIVLGLLAQHLAPTSLGAEAPARLPGLAMLLAGLGLDGWTIWTMRKARTNILPHRGADKLIMTGPFAMSRNPIYLGNTLAILGLAGLLNSLWLIAAAFAAAGLTSILAIRREEARLALRFGPAWTAYCARVPRWIGSGSPGRRPKAKG